MRPYATIRPRLVVSPKIFGDDLNRCLHVHCHGLVAIYLHLTDALYPFFFITLAFKYIGLFATACSHSISFNL